MAFDALANFLVELVQGTKQARINEPEQDSTVPPDGFRWGCRVVITLKPPCSFIAALERFVAGVSLMAWASSKHDGLPLHLGQHFRDIHPAAAGRSWHTSMSKGLQIVDQLFLRSPLAKLHRIHSRGKTFPPR